MTTAYYLQHAEERITYGKNYYQKNKQSIDRSNRLKNYKSAQVLEKARDRYLDKMCKLWTKKMLCALLRRKHEKYFHVV